MKSVGDWVAVKVEEGQHAYGIIATNENSGKVVSCGKDNSLIGKKVYFSVDNAKKAEGYAFIPYDDIYGVEE
jgi:hypothetical protein